MVQSVVAALSEGVFPSISGSGALRRRVVLIAEVRKYRVLE
jgi:hypothetical protein